MADTPKRPSRAKKPAPVEPEKTEEPLEEEESPEPEPIDDESELTLDEDAESEESTALVPASQSTTSLAPGAGPTDLLQRYMSEVNRYPLLTREEESRLAREYQRTGDPKLAYRLVTANLRLVVKIAWEYRRAAFNLLDLIQEGNVGLVQGVRKFDPERGVKLSSYSAYWIRAYIIRYLMDNWRLVKLGTTTAQRKLFFNLRKEKEKLEAQGFEPEPRLLAERLNVTEQDVVDMDRRLSHDDLSLDAPLGSSDESSYSLGDRLSSSATAADDRIADEQIASAFREHLATFAAGLKDKERYIYEQRLIADEPMTLQAIGDIYGISRERARQIEARLLKKLKAYMQEKLPGFAELSLESPEE